MLEWKKHLLLLLRRAQYTCGSLTLHGPSFLVRKDVHFIYRLIYFIIYVQVWIAAVVTIQGYFNYYRTNSIRFTTRNDYLQWNTTYASVTVCEIGNVDKIWSLGAEYSTQHNEKLSRFFGDIAFFSGTCFSCLSSCCNESMCLTDYVKMASYFHTSCKDFFLTCKWNGNPINCCKHFEPLQTEFGRCFSINNRHTGANEAVFVTSGNPREMGILEIKLAQDYEAFLHSPEDIPFWNMEYDRRVRVIYGAKAEMIFSILDVVNEPEVSLIAPEERECRFPEELPKNYQAFKYYSYSVCISQCRIDAQLELCNCTHHLSPMYYKDQYCDLDGLKCLTKHYKTLRKLKVPGSEETGLDCDCLPSCTESDYNVVSKSLDEPEKELSAKSARFILGNRPYQQLTRQVARTTLDLVVAVGNCFGLCFGGSLLSIVEVIYFICLKRWRA